MPTFGSLFSGVGGLDKGLEDAGWTCRWMVEIDDFCQKVLNKHWPDIPKFKDITELTGQELEPVDMIAGGFPCQDISVAGKRGGIHAKRSGLFFDLMRVCRVVRPRLILLENVPGLLSRSEWMGAVLEELAASGYDASWDCIPAAAVGAPHIRDRIFIVARATRKQAHEQLRESGRSSGQQGATVATWEEASRSANGKAGDNNSSRLRQDVADTQSDLRRVSGDEGSLPSDGTSSEVADPSQPERGRPPRSRRWLGSAEEVAREYVRNRGAPDGIWTVEPDVGRVAHGVPDRVHRLKALGNAVVPQVAEHVGRSILRAFF